MLALDFIIKITMYEELQEKAKKKVEARMGFYIIALVFAFVSIILLVVSFYVQYPASFWVRFPILILLLVLGIIYTATFGLPYSGILSKEWQEEEIEKEIARLYQEKRLPLPPPEELSEDDKLELKELERLKRKWEWGEDLV